MTEIKTKIPAEMEPAAVGGMVADAKYIIDRVKNKNQTEINTEVGTEITNIKGGSSKSIANLDSRLGTVEQLAEISIGGGDVQIATGSDFTNPDATKRAKVPTVGAIIDGLNDGVYDVSKRNPSGGPNSDGKFTLDYILDNADTLIPTSWRHGGMTISFVQSSDNNYVQYRLMSDSFNTTVANWQGVDDEPTAGSENLVKSGGVKRAIYNGQNILFDGNVDYSQQGYNRIIVNNVILPVPCKTGFIKAINTTTKELSIRLIHSDNSYDQFILNGEDLIPFYESADVVKIFAFFQTSAQPNGYVKINIITEPSIYYDIVNNFIIEQKNKSNADNKLTLKADIDVGVNLVNPKYVESGKYIGTNGGIANTSNQDYKVSGFIPVNGQDIITNGVSASYLGTFVVYDRDFNKLRVQVNSGQQYTYQDGDYYVRIGYETSGDLFANYGTTLLQTPFTEYNHYDMLRGEMNAKIAAIPIENIINGEKTICVNATEMDANGHYEGIDLDSFIYKSLATTSSIWCASKVFQPNLSLPVRIKAKAKLLQGTIREFNLWVSPTLDYDSQRTTNYHSFLFPAGVNEIDIDFNFDPQYFVVYKNFTTDFSIWIQSRGDGTTATQIQFDDFAIFQTLGVQTFNNFSGDNLPELLHSLDSAFPSDVTISEDESIKIAPNGKKFVLQVANNGDLITIPVIPTKAHFFGNSLLSGNVFGMAASDQYHDYYYLINAFISSKITGYSSDKHSISDFERAATIESARSLIQTLVGYLTGDEDLIFIQIGDNVSQQELENVFSISFKELILAIRDVCQTARIIIFGCWYSSTARIALLSQVAKETGCLFINITDLNIIANQSYIGAIQKRTYFAIWTLENVTNVVDNGEVHTGYAHNITVTFTVSGTSYTATVDSTSYTLDGTTLQYTSDYYIIPNSGVGSHPGDAGFKAITNRVLYKSGMVDTENYLN